MNYKVGDIVYYENKPHTILEKFKQFYKSPSNNLLIVGEDNIPFDVHENQLDTCNVDCNEYNQYSVLCQCCGFPYRIRCCKKI